MWLQINRRLQIYIPLQILKTQQAECVASNGVLHVASNTQPASTLHTENKADRMCYMWLQTDGFNKRLHLHRWLQIQNLLLLHVLKRQ